jgi:hypothetical protein
VPSIGCMGGISVPEFETPPTPWSVEFHALLAVRDLGSESLICRSKEFLSSRPRKYPSFAPIGAGMALRKCALTLWLGQAPNSPLSDRKGAALTSGGDNDIVMCILEAGWDVAYFPTLSLTHLIPSSRLDPDYLCRLNCGIQQSWMQVLSMHEANPWPPISSYSSKLRIFKAWFLYRPWTSVAARIRFHGFCGHFRGRVLETRS